LFTWLTDTDEHHVNCMSPTHVGGSSLQDLCAWGARQESYLLLYCGSGTYHSDSEILYEPWPIRDSSRMANVVCVIIMEFFWFRCWTGVLWRMTISTWHWMSYFYDHGVPVLQILSLCHVARQPLINAAMLFSGCACSSKGFCFKGCKSLKSISFYLLKALDTKTSHPTAQATSGSEGYIFN